MDEKFKADERSSGVPALRVGDLVEILVDCSDGAAVCVGDIGLILRCTDYYVCQVQILVPGPGHSFGSDQHALRGNGSTIYVDGKEYSNHWSISTKSLKKV